MGFLQSRGIEAEQMDLSIELINKLFTKEQLSELFNIASEKKGISKANKIILQNSDFYLQTIEPVMQFLSGRDGSLATRFSNLDFWTASKRFPAEEELEWAFGTIGNHDRATHLCTHFLKDISKFITETIDPHFELIHYAESLCIHLPEFAPLQQELEKPCSFIDNLMLEIFAERINRFQPDFRGIQRTISR